MENVSKAARMMVKNPNILQLYSAPTPNGFKVAAALEEISFMKSTETAFSYEPHTIDLRKQKSLNYFFNYLLFSTTVRLLLVNRIQKKKNFHNKGELGLQAYAKHKNSVSLLFYPKKYK